MSKSLAPSVAIHRRPLGSKAMLSGVSRTSRWRVVPWRCTWRPAPASPDRRPAGTRPTCKLAAAWSASLPSPGGDSSRIWPVLFSARGLAAIDLVRLALGVLGHHGIDLAVDRIGLEILRPVHRRRAEQIGGEARLDHHLALVGEAVLRASGRSGHAPAAASAGAIGVELRDRQLAFVEQVLVGRAVVRD